jgi:hypothetical protein
MTAGFSDEAEVDRERQGVTWRTGRKVGRTIYRQSGPEPSDDDALIGVMDTPELAAVACRARNAVAAGSAPLWG